MTSAFIATAFATAFTIIDPVGMIPLTVSVTANASPAQHSAIVDRAIVVAAIVILVMGILGKPLLDSLGITLPAFTIAGGALLFLIAVDMLFGRKTGTKQTAVVTRLFGILLSALAVQFVLNGLAETPLLHH